MSASYPVPGNLYGFQEAEEFIEVISIGLPSLRGRCSSPNYGDVEEIFIWRCDKRHLVVNEKWDARVWLSVYREGWVGEE